MSTRRYTALSVRQPWADHLVFGDKRIENRDWPTHYRGPLLIHATLKEDEDAPLWLVPPPGGADSRGGIVGVMTLVHCLSRDEAVRCYPDQERYAFGLYCWVLARPVPLPNIVPCRGQLGLFEPALDAMQGDAVAAFVRQYATEGRP